MHIDEELTHIISRAVISAALGFNEMASPISMGMRDDAGYRSANKWYLMHRR